MNRTFARRQLWAAALSVLTLATGCVYRGERHAGTPFHWSGTLTAGSTLEIHGVNGNIDVAPTDGPETIVDAEKWSRWSRPDRVRIEVDEDHDDVAIRAIYPWHWFGMGNDDVDVHFTVRVPRDVELRLSSVNGSIHGEGLRNRVVAHTVNGGVRIATAREADAATVNGSIVVRADPRSGDMHFRGVNGSVRLEIPSESSVRLAARSVNGWIETDFPAARIRGGFVGHSYHAMVGSGEADLDVSTVNGSIRVSRISAS
jgi:putative adhesin